MAVLAVILTISCTKDTDVFLPKHSVDIVGDIDRFFNAARIPIETHVTTNIDVPAAVVTERKSVIILDPGSLQDADGNLITGNVEVSILELMSPGEILTYGISTNSRGNLLESGGEFHLTIRQNGKPLTLQGGSHIRILTDLPNGVQGNQRMELFYDILEHDQFTGKKLYPSWEEADGNPNTWSNITLSDWAAIADSQQVVTGYGYAGYSDHLDWVHLAAFDQTPPASKTNVCIALPPRFVESNTAVFLVMKDQRTVLRLKGDPVFAQFCNAYQEDYQIGVPVDSHVSIIAVSEQGLNRYFFWMHTTTLKKNHNEFIEPVETPLENIRQVLATL